MLYSIIKYLKHDIKDLKGQKDFPKHVNTHTSVAL